MNAPDFEAVSWHVLVAPTGTPQDIVERLHAEMKRIMAIPEVNKKVASVGLIPIEIHRSTACAPTSSPKARNGAGWSGASASANTM